MWTLEQRREWLAEKASRGVIGTPIVPADWLPVVEQAIAQQADIERLKAESDRVTCSVCGCSIPRSVSKRNAKGELMCVDYAVASGCRYLAETDRLQRLYNQRTDDLSLLQMAIDPEDEGINWELDDPRWRDLAGRKMAEIAQLRAALRPFAGVAGGIPDNWPGQCRLRIDTRPDGSEYVAYHGVPDDHLGLLPTIAEWRALGEAAER